MTKFLFIVFASAFFSTGAFTASRSYSAGTYWNPAAGSSFDQMTASVPYGDAADLLKNHHKRKQLENPFLDVQCIGTELESVTVILLINEFSSYVSSKHKNLSDVINYRPSESGSRSPNQLRKNNFLSFNLKITYKDAQTPAEELPLSPQELWKRLEFMIRKKEIASIPDFPPSFHGPAELLAKEPLEVPAAEEGKDNSDDDWPEEKPIEEKPNNEGDSLLFDMDD